MKCRECVGFQYSEFYEYEKASNGILKTYAVGDCEGCGLTFRRLICNSCGFDALDIVCDENDKEISYSCFQCKNEVELISFLSQWLNG